MCNDQKSHAAARGIFISPEGWRILAGGNTPGNGPDILRPEGALERIPCCLIGPISPIRLMASLTLTRARKGRSLGDYGP